MSKYLIAKADTNSEWDCVDFALIELTPEWLEFVKKVQQFSRSVKNEFGYGFDNITFFGDNASFYVGVKEKFDNEIQDPAELIDEQEDCAIIDLSEDIVEKLESPEQYMRGGRMRIDDNNIQFVTYGKHTGEEYWTPEISIETIAKSMNNENKQT